MIIANTGENAVEIALSNDKINLVLVDIDLGKGIGGSEAARQIIKKRNIPVIFLTSHFEKEYVDRVKEITRYGYIVKNSGDFVLRSSIEMAFELFEAYEKIANELIERKRAEEELEKNKALLQGIFEGTTDAIYAKDLMGRYLIFNGAAENITGKNYKDVLGNDDRILFPEKEALVVMAGDQKIIKDRKTSTYEETVTTSSGEINTFLSTKGPLLDKHGNIFGLFGIARNITDRKKVEKELRLSCERLTEAQKNAKIGDWEADLLTGELYWSSVIFDIFGLDSKFFKPCVKDFYNAVHPDDREFVLESEKRSERTGVHDVVHRIIRPDGEIRFVHELARRYNDDNGNLIMLRGTVNDITERMQAENKHRESEEKYRLLHENAGIGISYYHPDGTVISYNRLAASHMNGLPEDFIGKSIYEIFSKQDADFFYERIKKATFSNEPMVYEDLINLPSGNKYFISTFTKITDSKNNISGIQIISQDITERKKMEDELHNSEEKIRTIFETMSEGLALNECIYNETGEMIDYRILEVNKAFYSIVDYESEQIVGNVASKLYGMSLDFIRSFLEMHKKNKTVLQTEFYSQISNKCYWVSTSPIINDKFVTLFIDITERKLTETFLKNQYKG